MSDEKLDDLYRSYFRAEMPRTLPPLPVNEPLQTRADRRSRYVLAAGIAGMIGLGLWLSANQLPATRKAPSKSSATNLLKDSEADGKKLLENMDE